MSTRPSFHAGYPMVMVGQDVTRHTRMQENPHWQRLRSADTPVTHFLETISQFYMTEYNEFEPQTELSFKGHPFHDMLVVAYLLRPDFFKLETLYVTVETNGLVTRGQTVADRRYTTTESTMDVCVGVDVDKVYDLFLDIVTT